jgi:hypothetical protein
MPFRSKGSHTLILILLIGCAGAFLSLTCASRFGYDALSRLGVVTTGWNIDEYSGRDLIVGILTLAVSSAALAMALAATLRLEPVGIWTSLVAAASGSAVGTLVFVISRPVPETPLLFAILDRTQLLSYWAATGLGTIAALALHFGLAQRPRITVEPGKKSRSS